MMFTCAQNVWNKQQIKTIKLVCRAGSVDADILNLIAMINDKELGITTS